MPELPDLEVIREFLAPALVSATIAEAHVRRPIILRNFLGGDAEQQLQGRRLVEVRRRGKFLLFALDDATALAVNPMLAGRLRYGEPLARDRTRDALVLRFHDGSELRYHDAADMGKIYLTRDLNAVPGFAELGPEANDPDLTLAVFVERLRRYRGEIKGVLTNQAFIAGIGNAYADEICWAARIYPFHKCSKLSSGQVAALHQARGSVLDSAIATLRSRVGRAIDVEIRDFLAVHGKPGQPCPRCGSPISEVTRAHISTHFCRTCQPGLLVGGLST